MVLTHSETRVSCNEGPDVFGQVVSAFVSHPQLGLTSSLVIDGLNDDGFVLLGVAVVAERVPLELAHAYRMSHDGSFGSDNDWDEEKLPALKAGDQVDVSLVPVQRGPDDLDGGTATPLMKLSYVVNGLPAVVAAHLPIATYRVLVACSNADVRMVH
jgi:hypothetical protein